MNKTISPQRHNGEVGYKKVMKQRGYWGQLPRRSFNSSAMKNNKQKTIATTVLRNEIAITSTKWLYRLVRGFRCTVRHIATGLAGGGVFNGNANREVITVPFLISVAQRNFSLKS